MLGPQVDPVYKNNNKCYIVFFLFLLLLAQETMHLLEDLGMCVCVFYLGTI